ncbi:T9SS type A sorting domain-containing protein [uncultured Draconibacterium sp.]|uniref:T9SS type A sorting domain-containing protein n=1 Tax=uncultured Draconibacterium sp. TaxID=1573823 RepID=UPI002601615A|nr:T9SS type A sorting domain-containing protein [uncultured Draconibacterium sp.]
MKIIKLTQIFISLLFMIAMEAFSQDYSAITQGVDTINGGALGSVQLLNPDAMPIAAGSGAYSGLVYSAAVHYGNGKALIVGHEGALVDDSMNKYDQLTFFVNTIKWLNSTKKSILIKNGWASEGNMSILITKLKAEGYAIKSTNQKIVLSDLINVGIIIFGNDWNNEQPYTQEEISTIEEFARNGGGVLIGGLGWSYSNNMDDYSMNNIAGIFGLRFGKDTFWDTPYITQFYPSISNLTVAGSISTIKNITATYTTSLPETLQNNETVRYSYTSSNGFLTNVLGYLPQDNELRDTIYNFYTKLFENYSMFQKSISLNNNYETAFIWLKERMYANLRLSKELTPEIIQQISSTLGLTNQYKDIWENHQVMLYDNSKLDEAQLKFTQDILNSIPSEINKLGGISFSDFLGSTFKTNIGEGLPSVNTFTFKIGTYPENQFPSDVSPGITAVFCAAMAHEINHIVDAYYVNANEKFKTRKEQLISQAGVIGGNYLRSTVTNTENDFFVQNPQEFFASIANQWFTNSEKVLELGLTRFDNDFKEPINQFLFYADVYSLGSDSTIFYKNDLNGNFSSFKVPIERDGNGNIEGIELNSTTYNFQLDNSGNVLNYYVDKELNDTITYYVSSPEFEAISPMTIFESKEIISTQNGDSVINRYSNFVYNPTYCSITDTLIIDVTLTGINQPNNTNTIRIYPNPAHSYVIVNTGNYQSMSDYSINIKNMLGQNVFNAKTSEQEIRIDLNNFGGYGIYIVEIVDNSNSLITTRKIVIQ